MNVYHQPMQTYDIHARQTLRKYVKDRAATGAKLFWIPPVSGWGFEELWHLGLSFWYKGDDITYVWPWRRTQYRKRWLNFTIGGTYNTLKQIDEFWNEYNEHNQLCRPSGCGD